MEKNHTIPAAIASHPKNVYVSVKGLSLSRGFLEILKRAVAPKKKHLPQPSKKYYKNFQEKMLFEIEVCKFKSLKSQDMPHTICAMAKAK